MAINAIVNVLRPGLRAALRTASLSNGSRPVIPVDAAASRSQRLPGADQDRREHRGTGADEGARLLLAGEGRGGDGQCQRRRRAEAPATNRGQRAGMRDPTADDGDLSRE